MPRAGFEPATPTTKRPQTYALESAATGIGHERYALRETESDVAERCTAQRGDELQKKFRLGTWMHVRPFLHCTGCEGIGPDMGREHALGPRHKINGTTRTEQIIHVRIVFWEVLPCKIITDRRFRGTCCLHHQGDESVDNYFTRQYLPEDNSELHTRRRENLKSHIDNSCVQQPRLPMFGYITEEICL
jgi:hypothetical protein